MFNKRCDLINFIVAISELASKANPNFFTLTNKILISNFLLRIKVEAIAKKKGISTLQMFLAAIFNTIIERYLSG